MKDNKIKTEDVAEEIVETKVKTPIPVIITVNNLALRDAPNGTLLGIAPAGHNAVSEITTVEGTEWGKLTDGSGYINMNYAERI